MDEIPVQTVAFVGGFLPRNLPAAAITTHLCTAFAAEYGSDACMGIALSDQPGQTPYPSLVRFEFNPMNQAAFHSAAEFLSLSEVDLVFLQYDPRMYPREKASLILSLAQALHMPLVTMPSHIPELADPSVRPVLSGLVEQSACLVVPGARQAALLDEQYGISSANVRIARWTTEQMERLPPHASQWREAARWLMECFRYAWKQHASAQGRLFRDALPAVDTAQHIPVTGVQTVEELPMLKLDHFARLNDETGMLKASTYSLPDYHQGYETASNARALMFALMLEQAGEGPFIPIETQASRHLAFLSHAFIPEKKRFHGRMDYQRVWQDEEGPQEAHGLVLWATGMLLGRSNQAGMLGAARRLFLATLPEAAQLDSLPAWSYTLLGVQEYLRRFPGDRVVARSGKLLLQRLVRAFEQTSDEDWPWFEEQVCAESAAIPQALLASIRWAGDARIAEIGLRSLDWLTAQQFTPEGVFSPFGAPGYYRRGGERAHFAQRPGEAQAMIAACLEAYRFTGDARWTTFARRAFQWFLGRNDMGQPLYDPQTGGCCDGLLYGSVDHNYGADALLAFLNAQLEMRLFDQMTGSHAAGARLPILRIGPSNPLITESE